MRGEPLFHIVKRNDISIKKGLLIRAITLGVGLILSSIFLSIVCKGNPFMFFSNLFIGNFGSKRKIWILLRDTSLLLGVGLALIPAFKMKFWNLGGNGQILIGCLVSIMYMVVMGKAGVADIFIVLTMIPASILAGAIWALLPAIFKAFFNTNESLFTLMMNYIAVGLVGVYLTSTVKDGSGTLGTVKTGHIGEIGNPYLLTIIIVAILVIFMNIYLKYTKQGYELTVVGESQNTAKYVGINVKFVIFRTMAISGAICGLIGLLIAGAIDHSITAESAKNMGFTAIMVAWLAKFNPLIMIGTSFFISFLSRGMDQVQSEFNITSTAASDIVIGVIYFVIIGVEFFINYQIIFNFKKNKKRIDLQNEVQSLAGEQSEEDLNIEENKEEN